MPVRVRPCNSRLLPTAFLLLLLAGCTRLGTHVEQITLPEGAPRVEDILHDLATNDAAIRNFKATGAFTLTSPEFEAVKRFRDGLIAFRRPADLCVIGRKYMGAAIFRLTCVGSEFLIEFPATREEPYYQIEGEHFASVPFSVSPSDIAREMFLPEDWQELKARDARIVQYNGGNQTARIEIGPKRAPRRRVEVTGPPWRVTRSERLNDQGEPIAITTKGDYTQIENVLFPVNIDAQFPSEQTRMTFEMRKVWPNTTLDNAMFDIKGRAREAGVDLDRPTPRNGETRRKKSRVQERE